MKQRSVWILSAVLGFLIAVEALLIPPDHPVFPWHSWPGLHGLIGLVACVVVVLLCKGPGARFLQRPEEESRDS